MAVEIRYIYGGYQITEPGLKRPARNAQEIRTVTNSLWGVDRETEVWLILDNRHFISYTKKQLQAVEQAILDCIQTARDCDIDLTITMRRELRTEINPKAGMISRTLGISEHTVTMAHPHVDVGRRAVAPITDRVLKAVDDVGIGVGNQWHALRQGKRDCACPFMPYQWATTIAQLGDLHPMESTDVSIDGDMITYRFKDQHKREWSLTTPCFQLSYDEAMDLIQKDDQSKRYLEMFYNSTANPIARLADEVINMLLPWSCRVATNLA